MPDFARDQRVVLEGTMYENTGSVDRGNQLFRQINGLGTPLNDQLFILRRTREGTLVAVEARIAHSRRGGYYEHGSALNSDVQSQGGRRNRDRGGPRW